MQLKKRVIGAVGRIEEYAAAIPPRNTIKANGAELSRALFWRLFKHAQESGNLVAQGSKQRGQYGTGDGISTFTIPDRRGVVGRGFDDGAGLDSVPTLGRYQADDIKAHNHASSAAASLGSRPVGGGVWESATAGSMTGTTGGSETTMKNITLLYCIRYQ
jgi:hypothetical protein|tara:strand:+ start:623 stop:1102 length:480 start_codon:yes stop_codon:yes gene_type:complete